MHVIGTGAGLGAARAGEDAASKTRRESAAAAASGPALHLFSSAMVREGKFGIEKFAPFPNLSRLFSPKEAEKYLYEWTLRGENKERGIAVSVARSECRERFRRERESGEQQQLPPIPALSLSPSPLFRSLVRLRLFLSRATRKGRNWRHCYLTRKKRESLSFTARVRERKSADSS